MPRSRLLLLLLIASCLFAGCDATGPATVSGVITLDGKPLPKRTQMAGEVMFYPISGGAAAYGTITPEGSYSLSTGGSKGLQPGEYVVTVRVVEIDPPPPGGYRDAPSSKPITPRHYQDREKSMIKVLVSDGKNDIPLPLVTS